MYQDNISAMLLENNGKKYSTKNTKHINVRYYFNMNLVETGDVVIKYFPMKEMLREHFTNPLQGALFSTFRAKIMNILDDLDMGEMGMDRTGFKKGITCKLRNETDSGCPKECVGDCGKAGRINGAMGCPNGDTYNGTYDAFILEKGERSWVATSYADVTREDMISI